MATGRLAFTRPPLNVSVLVNVALLGVFATALVRTAWLSDDAYITLRTVDNLVSGYGARWNVVERVQTYTHPLWMFMLAVPYSVTRDPYFTPLVLSMLLSLGVLWLFVARIALSVGTAIVGATVLTFSQAFVDYSTSGLENPLSHLLLAIFLIVYWHPGLPRRATILWLVAALVMLNRLDLGLLVLPVLMAEVYEAGWRTRIGPAAIGLVPLVIWELFSVVYYGFPFPNTAYAKLPTSVSAGELIRQGLVYVLDSVSNDPVTLVAMGVFVVASLATRFRESWPVALGIMLYAAYTVRVGGDFMSGRFFTAPLFCAVALIGRFEMPFASLSVPAATATIVALGLFGTTKPPLATQTRIDARPARAVRYTGIADERSAYYRFTGLLRWSRDRPLPESPRRAEAREARQNSGVIVRDQIGMLGYYAGPEVHIVDPIGLGDALLARLPARPNWRIGHFARRVPDGYVETVQTGENVIVDPEVAMKYERLKAITQDPLWTRRRWRAILAMNGS